MVSGRWIRLLLTGVFIVVVSDAQSVWGLCPYQQYGGTIALGGQGIDVANAMAIDSIGNTFITGGFEDQVDFDPTDGIDLRESVGNCSAFATKMNVDGTYAWTWALLGPGCDNGLAVATGEKGSAVIVGLFGETVDFDPGEGVDEHSPIGGLDVYITKLSADGSYGWTRTLGADFSGGVVVDAEGNILVTGCFFGTFDLDPSEEGEDIRDSAGQDDAFVLKLTADGDYIWGLTFGGEECETPGAMTLGTDGAVYVTGRFEGTADFDPTEGGVDEHTSNGDVDAFLTKLGLDGSYEWTATLGSAGFDWGKTVAVDSSGNVAFGGSFQDDGPVDFDPGEGVDERQSAGQNDAFVTKLASDGTYLGTWTAGSASGEGVRGVAFDPDGALYITGWFGATNLPPDYMVDFDAAGEGDVHATAGDRDTFITQLHGDGSYGWTQTFGGPGLDEPRGLALDSENNVSVTGAFRETSDFDFTEGEDLHTSNGSADIFVTKLLCTDEFPCEGDANGDGLVDPLDSGFVLARFGCDVGAGDPSCDLADMNGDDLVDPLDVGFILARFGPCE